MRPTSRTCSALCVLPAVPVAHYACYDGEVRVGAPPMRPPAPCSCVAAVVAAPHDRNEGFTTLAGYWGEGEMGGSGYGGGVTGDTGGSRARGLRVGGGHGGKIIHKHSHQHMSVSYMDKFSHI